MRKSWKIFIAAMLMLIGLQLNFTESIFVVAVAEPWQSILFFVLLGVALLGIWDQENVVKDIASMGIIVTAVYYFGSRLPIAELVAKANSTVLRVISIILIVFASFWLLAGLVDLKNFVSGKFKRKTKKSE